MGSDVQHNRLANGSSVRDFIHRLALTYSNKKAFFATASLLLFALWLPMAAIYRRTAREAREVLIAIEIAWDIPDTAFRAVTGALR